MVLLHYVHLRLRIHRDYVIVLCVNESTGTIVRDRLVPYPIRSQ